MPKNKDPCQRAACAIQKCLQAHSYMERMCEPELEEMRSCCAKYTAKHSLCCSGFKRHSKDDELRGRQERDTPPDRGHQN